MASLDWLCKLHAARVSLLCCRKRGSFPRYCCQERPDRYPPRYGRRSMSKQTGSFRDLVKVA